MDILLFLLSCIGIGAFCGLCVGLLGIGSGVIIVPALSALLVLINIPVDERLQVAIATSLATMVVTTAVSSFRQILKKNVRVDMLKYMVPTIILGGMLGAILIRYIAAPWLKGFFSIILFLMALNLWRDRMPNWHDLQKRPWLLSTASGGIATLSTLLGLGGGVFFIPVLRGAQVPIKEAIGTSNICSFLVSLSGTMVYIFNAKSSPFDGLSWHTGYIYWPAVIGIIITSIPFAVLGTHLMHRAASAHLQRAFAVLLMLVAFSMFLS